MGTSLLAKLTVDGAPVNARLDDGLMYALDAIAADLRNYGRSR